MRRLELRLRLHGAHRRTRVDLTLLDPAGFRGFGMTQAGVLEMTTAAEAASPGVLRGEIVEGEWTLLLLWVNPEAGCTAELQVVVDEEAASTAGSSSYGPPELVGDDPVLDQGPGWRKGDLHVHSSHSTGRQAVADLVAAARAAGLDFLSITDHNTVAAWPELAVAQRDSRDLLLLRGQELTAPWGHANVHGADRWIDPEAAAGGMSELCRQVHDAGGLLGVNHPFSNEAGWQRHDTDWSQVDLIEVHHALEYAHNGMQLAYWDRLLGQGMRVTGVAGSDSKDVHDPKYGFGRILTWVYADQLSTAGILHGLLRGQVVVSRGPRLDLWAESESVRVPMGGTVRLGEPLVLRAEVSGLEGSAVLYILKDGLFLAASVLHQDGAVAIGDLPERPCAYRVELYRLADVPLNGYDRRQRSWEAFLAASNPLWAGDLGDGGAKAAVAARRERLETRMTK